MQQRMPAFPPASQRADAFPPPTAPLGGHGGPAPGIRRAKAAKRTPAPSKPKPKPKTKAKAKAPATQKKRGDRPPAREMQYVDPFGGVPFAYGSG